MLVVLLGGCGVPGADGPADSFGLDFSLPPDSRVEGAVIFLVDGVNAEIFHEMLVAGKLPMIKKYFVDRGVYCPHAIANTPSVTFANLTSLVTGLFPGHHGVTGINWFDRNELVWRNYDTIAQKNMLDADYTAPNLYEQFPNRTTFSIFFQPHRHATKFVENWASAGPPFFFGWYEFVDRLTLHRFNIVADIARKRRSFPAVTIAYLLAPDFRAYEYGLGTQEYRQALRHTDRQIGRVLGDLERDGLLDKLTIVLTADHSLCDVKNHFPLEQFLREQVGLQIARKHLWEMTPFERRLDYYSRFPAVLYGSGDRYWAIHLRRPIRKDSKTITYAPWIVRPTAGDLKSYPTRSGTTDLLSVLCEQEAVDALGYRRGPDRVRVRTKGGEVEFRSIAKEAGTIAYHLISGTDPLGWKGKAPDKALNGEPLTGREWGEVTCATNYPDLPAQILAYFRSRRAGDIAVFAEPGWDFSTVNKAGHGGVRPCDMHVPLILAGPGIPHKQIPFARTVDVYPTLLTLLGRSVPANLDGKPLLDPEQ